LKKIVIVSNRLPVKVEKNEESLVFSPTSGGLATGLKSFHEDGNALWIGWPGINREEFSKTEEVKFTKSLIEKRYKPIHLTKSQVDDFYLGLSNESIWPLFHYFKQNVLFDLRAWNTYKEVNQLFADSIIDEIQPGDTVWIHDYQLLLVANMVRQKVPGVTIGFFLHIPFPSYEIFRIFPKRQELLEGLLGADLIGFHTFDYQRHFISSVKRILHHEVNFNRIILKNREVLVDTFPMGIDFEKFERVSQSIELQSSKEDSELKKQIANHRSGSGGQLILSIDRLDYTKGILNRIEAFELFLKRYPEYHGKVRLVMIIVPSRSEVPHYQKLKKQTDESIGRVNGEYSTINWTPIWYYYRSFEFEDLISLYKSCEIAMVTPLRDGMNLVAKEFLATKLDAKGTLILSELAGASKELHNALLVNPFDIDQLAETIYEALNLSEPEQVERNTPMRQRIKRYDIHAWAKRFMETLINKEQEHHQEPTIKINSTVKETITKAYNSASNRLILLDYDGTLTGFHTNHHKAVPSQQLLNALENLSKNNDLAIISGRAPDFLEKHFGHLSIDLIAEHGHIRKIKGETAWAEQNHSNDEWVAHLLPVMQQFADNTPGTFVEVKRNALVWHYRKTDPELGIVKSEELKTILASMVSNEVHLMSGDKIVEVVSSSVNKGTAALERYHHNDYDFVLVAGDDVTDEDMFTYLPSKNTFSIKVGNKATSANYRIADSNQMVDLLDSLVTTNE